MYRYVAFLIAGIFSALSMALPGSARQSHNGASGHSTNPLRVASASTNAVDPEKTPPFDLADADRIEAGKKRFNRTCVAYCHGHEGSGGRTLPFKGRTELTPEFVFKTITNGRRGADVMPKWGNSLSAEVRWELTAYIMYLTTLPAGAE